MMGEEYPKKKSSPSAMGTSTTPENLFEMPKDVFYDVVDELENDLHQSRRAKTNEEKVSHTLDFLSLGLALLPEGEKAFVDETREFIEKHGRPPLPDTMPGISSDKLLGYDISISLRSGFTTRSLEHDMPAIRASLVELAYQEILQKLMGKRDETVVKLIKYDILELREVYKGGNIRGALRVETTEDYLEGIDG